MDSSTGPSTTDPSIRSVPDLVWSEENMILRDMAKLVARSLFSKCSETFCSNTLLRFSDQPQILILIVMHLNKWKGVCFASLRDFPRITATPATWCHLCLSRFTTSDLQAIQLQCKHTCHKRCLVNWCKTHEQCRECQEPITAAARDDYLSRDDMIERFLGKLYDCHIEWGKRFLQFVFFFGSVVTSDTFQNSEIEVPVPEDAYTVVSTDELPPDTPYLTDPCSLCLETLSGRAALLPCHHLFHATCIHPWFQCHSKCPLCRQNVITKTVSTYPSALFYAFLDHFA